MCVGKRMAFNVNLQVGVARATVSPVAPTPTTGRAPTPSAERSRGSDESFERTSGTRRQGLDMGGAQPTHHAMLVPKEQIKAQGSPSASGATGTPDPRGHNYGTPQEIADGLFVDKFGFVESIDPSKPLRINIAPQS